VNLYDVDLRLTFHNNAALKKAKEQTERLERGEKVGPLAGVPIAVKDLEDVKLTLPVPS